MYSGTPQGTSQGRVQGRPQGRPQGRGQGRPQGRLQRPEPPAPAPGVPKKDSHVSWGPPPTRINIPDDEPGEYAPGFEDQEIRQNFIRMVYMILFVQLIFTAAIVAFFKYYVPACVFVLTTPMFWYLCLGASLVLVIMISCCANLRHQFPINLILLFLFTLVEGILLGGITCRGNTMAVLYALGMTLVVVIVLTLFAWQTTIDFTVCMGAMLVLLVILFVMGICCIFIHDKTLHLVYAGLGCFVFSIYLVIDTQLILGGNHAYSLAPDEYILGALHLYLDIIMLFLYIYNLIMGCE